MSEYQVKLYYGFEETECGIFHAFEAVDPEVEHDDAVMAERLARQLDNEAENDNFTCRSMYINLPKTLIEKIKAIAVKEYIEGANVSGE